jgi:hypothetical protein
LTKANRLCDYRAYRDRGSDLSGGGSRAAELAETRFPGYDTGDAYRALLSIAEATEADLPERILLEAARIYLQTVDTMAFLGPYAILQHVLFAFDLSGEAETSDAVPGAADTV